MSAAAVRGVVRRLGPPADPPTDADLVAAFVARRDHAAFAELVRRHGPTVLGACRRVLSDTHAAEDAFQAVFLVLARKAAAVRPPGAVGGWLYGVAVRTANKARVAATRRRRHEMATALASQLQTNPDRGGGGGLENDELRAVLDSELARLPEAVRAAVVLCDLQGKTRADAAAELGCPEGTVAARLHRGRKKLADALTRRGLALPAAGLAAVLAPAAVSAALSQSAFALASGTASAAVRALAHEVIRSMTTITHAFALGFLTLLTGGLLAAGTLLSGEPAPPAEGVPDELTPAAAAPDVPNGQSDHGGRVYSVSYSPDGERFLTVGGDRGVVWDADSRKKLFTFDAEFAAFSGDGKNVFVLVKEEFRTLDADTGKQLDKKPRQQPKPVLGGRSAAFAESAMMWVEFDGVRHHLRTELTDDLYDLAEQTSTLAFSVAIPNHGRGGAFGPDGKRFAGIHRATKDYKEVACLTIWNSLTGVRVGTIWRDFNHPVLSFAWSPDGKEIAVGFADGVRVYDAETIKEVRKLDPPGKWGDTLPHTTALAWSADGKTIAAAVTAEVRTAEEKDTGETVVKVTAIRNAVRLLDARTGKEQRRFDDFADNLPVASLALRPDGKQLVCGAGFFPGDAPAANVPQPAKDAPGLRVIALDAPKPAVGAWKEMKVLDLTGWLGGSVAYSADGKTLYVGGTHGLVRAYDATTWKQLWEAVGEGRLAWIALSPDGKQVARAVRNGLLFLDAATGKSGDLLEEKESEPLAVAWFPNEVVAPGVSDRKVIFGNARGYFVKTWLEWPKVSTITTSTVAGGKKPADEYAVPLAVSPDGKRVVVTGPINKDTGKNVLWAWSAGSGAGNQLLEGHKAAVTSAAWSKDGKLIVTGDADGVVITWDAATFREKSRQKLGGRVAAVGVGGGTKAVNADKPEFGKPLGKVLRRRDGNAEINLGSDAGVRAGQTFIVLPADFPEKGVQSRTRVFRVPDGSGGFKNVERFVEKATFEVTEVLGPNLSRCRITREPDPIRDGTAAGDLVYAPAGARAAGYHVAVAVVRRVPGVGQGAYAEEVFVWPAANPPAKPEPISRHEAGAPFAGVASLAFAPDGKTLASAFCNFDHLTKLGELVGKVRVFTLEPEKPKADKPEPAPAAAAEQKWTDAAVLTDHGTLVNGVAVSPDGKTFAAATDRGVALWDSATRKLRWKVKLTDAPCSSVAYSGDGKSLFVAGKTEVVRLDAATGETGDLFGGAKGVAPDNARHMMKELRTRALALSADGRRLAGSDGYTAWMVEPDTAENRGSVVHAGGDPKDGKTVPVGVAWSPDGKRLAWINPKYEKRTVPSGLRPDTHWPVRLWNVGEAGPFGVLAGHDHPVTALAWSKDGKVIASGDEKGVVILWDAATGKELWRHAFRGRDDTDGRVNALAISPADNTIAVAVSMGSGKGPERVVLLEPKGGEGVGLLPRQGGVIPFSSVEWSPDGKFLLTGCGAAVAQSEPAVGEVVVWERKP